ncbi:MAG: GNAT family N-acetyltransferase [Ginsengibacter sp.]
MNFEIIYASREYHDAIKNLMQLYMHDFSEYVEQDVEEDGLYKPYPGLEDYWNQDTGKFPYIIKKENKYAGFILVKRNVSVTDSFSIAEFFILKKYRKAGIGRAAAKQIFDLYKGNWEVHQRENNLAARSFWEKVIHEYTSGQFSQRLENGRTIQHFRNNFQL